MNKYLYVTKNPYDFDKNHYIVISDDPKRDGLLKSTLYLNENLEHGFSDKYGKCHQSYLVDLVKKSTKID